VRLTGTGVIVLATAMGLFALGWWTTDNLLVLIGLVLGTPIIADLVLGRRALSRVSVERALPVELFATHTAMGGFRVGNVAGRVVVEDRSGNARCETQSAGECPVEWRFERRGRRRLSELYLRSRHPLGLIEHRRCVEQPVDVWVAPRPVPGGVEAVSTTDDVDRAQAPSRSGDFLDLRTYVDGDSVRSVHWRTSARRGELVVVRRAGDGGSMVVVDVPACKGDAWERALEQGCGSFLEALRHGPVVLRLEGQSFGPGREGRFRARGLRALAEAQS
jgi:uncharacterized protein (DUF58 family)